MEKILNIKNYSSFDNGSVKDKRIILDNVNRKIFIETQFVDLGLPSGTKWATTNVGADKPEDFGLYFAWGETEGYSGITEDKGFYYGDYKYTSGACTGATDNTFRGGLTKYNNVSTSGVVDNLTVLELVDDAAYQADNTCKIPHPNDCVELINNTVQKYESINGVSGLRFYSKKNNNSIFLPKAGYCYKGQELDVHNFGCYWTSMIMTNGSRYCYGLFFDGNRTFVDNGGRIYGVPIRAIKK